MRGKRHGLSEQLNTIPFGRWAKPGVEDVIGAGHALNDVARKISVFMLTELVLIRVKYIDI